MEWPDGVTELPFVLYGLGALFLAVAAASVLPQISERWTIWVDAQRRRAEARDDADIADLRRQVQNLTQQITRLDDLVRDLYAYGWDRYEQARQNGLDADPPPPMRRRRPKSDQ